ncbi:MAG: hypothetical protein AB7Q16_21230 [Vicinamibacterales bacterium]
MEEAPISAREFKMAVESMQNEMRTGFSGVNARLDKVNGQLDKHAQRLGVLEADDAEQCARLDGHDREIRDIKRTPTVQVQAQSVQAPAARAVNISIPMDTKTVVAVIGALATLILMMLKGLA